MKYADLIAQMTLEEKASLCSGKDMWHTKAIERLGIPSVMMCDGPHGLRKQDDSGVSTSLNVSVDAICFPTASATASSWDKALLNQLGQAIGDEAVAENVALVLGPGTNIKRSPLCGRNFEYFSEDPYLAGMLSASFIDGVQSKNIGTSIKHYCANNQETYRMTINSVVDERTLREIYLLPFEIAVKQSQPRTIMASYNLINDTYATENEFLLNKVLRDEWGFEGLVVSDWGATNKRVKGLKAGHDLEMPSSGGMNDKLIVKAVKDGSLDESVLDTAVDRILDLVMKSTKNPKDATYDKEEHYQIAKNIAKESAVLLKNDGSLPLQAQKILLVGELAIEPRFQGAGSSFVNCTKISTVEQSLRDAGIEYEFTSGYDLSDESVKKNAKLRKNAVELAKNYDTVLVVAGLPEKYEAEGFDRKHINMPQSHDLLIEELAQVNKNVNVVLTMGSSVEMPWIDKVRSVLCMYLGGQSSGDACVDLLLGRANPCGKLAETFAIKLSDVPSTQNFPGARFSVEYREGLYVGYRYFNTANVPVLFPFGHGLSYTKFEYSNLTLSSKNISDKEILTATVDVQNVGDMDGKEIIQLYVNDVESSVYTPYQQLKGFEKIFLKAGEKKSVTFSLDKRSFAFYNVNAGDWQVESGEFKIMIGASSRDIRLEDSVTVNSTDTAEITPTPADSWYCSPDANREITKEEFLAMAKLQIKEDYRIAKKGEFTEDDSFEDMANTSGLARFALKIAKPAIRMSMKAKKDDPNYLMIYEVMKTSPMRALAFSSQGMFNMKMVDGVVTVMNGKFFKGVGMVLKNIGGDEEDKAKKKAEKAKAKEEAKQAKKSK
ncbi:MAG: glycoside hydrolase family 3 C-terminal domain-containing protein [Clostridia bacterium]|nr:glycoside hydrolase family 3 C-terminal domain-containing protein [Clostridia bacterium]